MSKKKKFRNQSFFHENQTDFFSLLESNNYEKISETILETKEEVVTEKPDHKIDYSGFQPIGRPHLQIVHEINVNSEFMKKIQFIDDHLSDFYLSEALKALFNRGTQRNWARGRAGKYWNQIGGELFGEEAESQAIFKTIEYFQSYKRTREYFWLLEDLKNSDLPVIDRINKEKRAKDLLSVIVSDPKTCLKPITSLGALQGYSVNCFKNHYNNEIRTIESKKIPSDTIRLSYVSNSGDVANIDVVDEYEDSSTTERDFMYRSALRKIDDFILAQNDPDLWKYHQTLKDNAGSTLIRRDYNKKGFTKNYKKVEKNYRELVRKIKGELGFDEYGDQDEDNEYAI